MNICQQDHSETGSMYCIIKCIVQGKQARVKNSDLRHPSFNSCNVITQICFTRPQCVKRLSGQHFSFEPRVKPTNTREQEPKIDSVKKFYPISLQTPEQVTPQKMDSDQHNCDVIPSSLFCSCSNILLSRHKYIRATSNVKYVAVELPHASCFQLFCGVENLSHSFVARSFFALNSFLGHLSLSAVMVQCVEAIPHVKPEQQSGCYRRQCRHLE